jgi:hypothetical protein
MRLVVETKRKVGFGAEESLKAVARRGDPASPRGVNSGPDVAQPPSTAHALALTAPAALAFTLEAAGVPEAAGPKRRGGGGSLPAWWGREMGVLL